jgi:hypothetical protein
MEVAGQIIGGDATAMAQQAFRQVTAFARCFQWWLRRLCVAPVRAVSACT